ncbi:uncharacterized protein LOC143082870 [Mytilus galloprovincialis]|uniref:uncharacterized protein LOC143082870 n=1 Tax=Mytilus galloprovincialis TaxID=29158 RepID=UPI003F7C8B81
MDDYYMNGLLSETDRVLPVHTQRPGHDGQLQRLHLQRMQDKTYDSDDDDSDMDNFDLDDSDTILQLNPAHGQTVALWSFMKLDSIAVFPPDQNLVGNIVEYAEKHFGFLRFQHRLMLLSPGQLSPVSLNSVYSIRPGSVVMVMPEENAIVSIEIGQLKTSFELNLDLSMTVQKLKTYIRKRKGIPVERQEILYSNRALENDKRLFEYRIKNRSILHVMIQAHFDLLINVETFWGKTYRFYLDPCSTGTDIVYAVFNRAFSANGPEDAGLHELYVPLHVLVLQYQNKLVNWDYCIAYLGIHTGETLVLSTVGHQSHIQLETVNVVTESGEKYDITVSQYDRWSVLAFMLHGLTNVPVDLIRLYKDGKRADFSSTIGQIERHQIIVMNVVMTHIDRDLVFGVPLKISIGHGILENVRISANKTVRKLKRKLERMGVPNASLYELTIGNQKLSNNYKIMDLVFDLSIPLVLKLETYPVFAHAPDGVIYKTYLRSDQTIASFKHKIELKTGYSLKSSHLIVAGRPIPDHPKNILYECGISCRNSIFFHPANDFDAFFILGNKWLEKIKIPLHNPSSTDIRNAVWNTRKLPEGSLNCVLTILYWIFMPKIAATNTSSVRTKIKKRMPVARETLYKLKKQGKLQFSEKELLGKQDKPRAVYSSPIPGADFKRPLDSAKIYHHIKTNTIPKFEPDQIIDLNEKLESCRKVKCHPKTGLPQIYDPPRSTIPPWMKNIQTRNQTNRLTLANVEGGPNGMDSVHVSKLQQIHKKIGSKLNDVNVAHKSHRQDYSNNFSKRNRFMYDYQHFDYVASEDGHDAKSVSTFPHKLLPKLIH